MNIILCKTFFILVDAELIHSKKTALEFEIHAIRVGRDDSDEEHEDVDEMIIVDLRYENQTFTEH